MSVRTVLGFAGASGFGRRSRSRRASAQAAADDGGAAVLRGGGAGRRRCRRSPSASPSIPPSSATTAPRRSPAATAARCASSAAAPRTRASWSSTAMRGSSPTRPTSRSSPTSPRASTSRRAASSPSISAPGTNGRTASRSPPRISASTGRTWRTTPEVSRFGPPKELLVDGEKPVVEFPDALTVRYTWSKPNSYFLPALAAAQPVEIFRPAHYLKQFHAKYAGLEDGEEDGRGGRRAELGLAALQQGPLLPERQPRLPDAAALGAEDAAAVRPLRLRAQSLFLSRRRGGPAASLYRPGRDLASRAPTSSRRRSPPARRTCRAPISPSPTSPS